MGGVFHVKPSWAMRLGWDIVRVQHSCPGWDVSRETAVVRWCRQRGTIPWRHDAATEGCPLEASNRLEPLGGQVASLGDGTVVGVGHPPVVLGDNPFPLGALENDRQQIRRG